MLPACQCRNKNHLTGTARIIREANFPVDDISAITNSPEMLAGRVKTLHPAVHAGILARDMASDQRDLDEQRISMVDFVVCNLYPFKETAKKIGVTTEEAVEEIDVGGESPLQYERPQDEETSSAFPRCNFTPCCRQEPRSSHSTQRPGRLP